MEGSLQRCGGNGCENGTVKALRYTAAAFPAGAVVILAWPAIHWLFWPGYISTYDGIYHLTRMIEVDALVRQGIFYPRWFPDFGLGHGYPIFNFFPPVGYLLTELPALIAGDLPLAIQLSMAASLVLSGWGMYALARDLAAGRLAATAVAILYMYFPYHIQDIYTRGGMPELWSMAWLPWLVWAQLRATRAPSVLWVGIAGVLAAMHIGTHNILAAFILPTALLVSLALSPRKRPLVLASLACSGLGLLLSAGYWLPAIVEAPLTHVRQLAGDWLPNHTFDVSQLIEPGFFAPYGGQAYKLTTLQAALVLAVLAALLWRGSRARRLLPELGLAGLMVAVLFLLTRWSVFFWLNAPLMGYIQFPWRLLILVGFLSAVMMAVVASWHRFAWIGLAALGTMMAVSSLGQVPDSRFAPPASLDARTLESQEYGSALDGVAIESEYQPQTSSPDLVKSSQGKRLPDDDTSMPPLVVRELTLGPTQLHALIAAEQPTRVRLQTLYFAGWQARLDSRPWAIEPATPAGLIEALVPQGTHTLDVAYGGTPLETASGLLSAVTLIALAAWVLRRRPLMLIGVLAIIVVSAGLLWHPLTAESAVRPVTWSPSPDHMLVGVKDPRATDRGIQVDLMWLFRAPREATFDFVLRDGLGREVRRMAAREATTMPYEYVVANELFQRRYTLTGLSELTPGSYALLLEAPGTSVDLGPVSLAGSAPPTHTLGVPFQDKASLVGYTVHRVQPRPGLAYEDLVSRTDATLNPGDFMLVSLLWRSQRAIDQNYVTFVHLLDASGKSWASHDNQPNATLQATSSWVPGQSIPDRFLLRVPDDAPAGVFRLEVGLYHIDELGYHFLPLASGGNSVVFGSVKIRPRSAATPSAVMASWTEPIGLQAWRQSRQGEAIALTFDWLASGPPSRDYTLFVHLSDSSGRLVAQADSPPQAGAFPTGSWESGDHLSDMHVLRAVPAGRWRLTVGWYEPQTGRRLLLSGGGDELDVGEIVVPSS